MSWLHISEQRDLDVMDWYTKPIFMSARPYAVVRANGTGYDVTPAESIEHASVIADAVLQEHGGDPGLRIYLRHDGWMTQVHYAGAEPWPTHQECIDRVEWNRYERVRESASGVARYRR